MLCAPSRFLYLSSCLMCTKKKKGRKNSFRKQTTLFRCNIQVAHCCEVARDATCTDVWKLCSCLANCVRNKAPKRRNSTIVQARVVCVYSTDITITSAAGSCAVRTFVVCPNRSKAGYHSQFFANEEQRKKGDTTSRCTTYIN